MIKKLSIIGFITCLILIFLLSAQTAPDSAGLSRRFTVAGVVVCEQLGLVAAGTSEAQATINRLNNQFRQFAHSLAFFTLALTLGFSLKHMGLKGLLLTLLVCVAFAALDELHQNFVPGRGTEWRDFKSDTQGVLLGLLLVGLSSIRFGGIKKRHP